MGAKQWLTTDEAAQRLGVKHETLYAYVSRGVVSRRLSETGKGSEFSRREIEQLATRATRPNRRGSFDVTIATQVSTIDGDQLFFRGVPVIELVESASFEETADLVWDGADGPWPKKTPKRPPGLAHCLRAPDRLRLAVAYSAATSTVRTTIAPPLVRATARALIVSAAAAVGDGPPTSVASILAGDGADPTLVRLFDVALLTMTDHEMATSTLAARVAASTRAGTYDVVLAGLGALAGPLHGSAGRMCHELLLRCEERGIDSAVEDLLRNGQRLPGIGHQVYRTTDPRTQPMLDALFKVVSPLKKRRIVDLQTAMTARVPKVLNCDFALGAMSWALERSEDLAEEIFSIARMAGWVAHALEEYEEQPLRYRGRALSY